MLLSSLASLAMILAEAAPASAEEKAPPVIDIDGTVLVQFAIFVAMYLVLSRFLFKPYLKMRAEREANIEGAEKKAHEMEGKREAMEASYELRMQKARGSAEEERSRLQSQARLRETELLSEARQRSQQRIAETQKKILAQVAAAQIELAKQAEPMAHALASKLLRREV